MKKLFVALFAIGFIFSMSSCKKDYTCECTFSPDGSTSTTMTFDYENVKKQDAEDVCATQESLYKLTDTAASCKLK